MFSFVGVIKGPYVSMKNGRRAFRAGNRMIFVKKEKALTWEQLALQQIRKPKTPYEGEVGLIGIYYYDNKRADLDENLLKDMLQVKKNGGGLGIIKDDNQVKLHLSQWEYDKENPRVEFRVVDTLTFKSMVKLIS